MLEFKHGENDDIFLLVQRFLLPLSYVIWRQVCSFHVTNPISFPNLGGQKTPPPHLIRSLIYAVLCKKAIKYSTRPTG